MSDNQIEVLGLEEIEAENTSIEELENEVVNLFNLSFDGSGSMEQFESIMRECLKDFKEEISESKEADDILIARTDFGDTNYPNMINVGGYKKINEFDTNYRAYGGTPLYDMIGEVVDKFINYINYLKNNGMRVRGLFYILSDGRDEHSVKLYLADAKKKIKELKDKEIKIGFIAFGKFALEEAERLGFSEEDIFEAGKTKGELRRIFGCISKSVKEESQGVMNKTFAI